MRFSLNTALFLILAATPSLATTGKHAPPTPPHHATSRAAGSGLASFYGKREQGRRMANGQRFDRLKFTAASRTLPLGTWIEVTNHKTGLSTEVEITDRGPWVSTRILDLAEAAAEAIQCSGVCKVQYVVIKKCEDSL